MRPDLPKLAVRWTALTLALLAMVMVVVIGLVFLFKVNSRYQRRADANNNVKVTQTNVRRVREQVGVTKQEAEVRYQESLGIRRAQDEIARTLTDRYLQHEAIQAQLKMAGSPSHTQVYVPSGNNGIPVVQTAPQP